MPRRKRAKSKEEKLAENFFPVDETSVSHSVEKEYKKQDYKTLEKVEKQGKKRARKSFKKRPVRKISRAKTAKEFKPKKIKLKKEGEGYELIITEKPQAALKIASALGKSVKRNEKNVPYYEVDRNGKKIEKG